MRLTPLLALGAALLTTACATAAPEPPPLAAPSANDPPRLATYEAPGDGPHPGVLLVPACEAPLFSSRAALYGRAAAKLNAEGYDVAVLSYPMAGLGLPACHNTSPAQIALEIEAGLAALRAMPGVDPHRLHVVGWSWGGRGVLEQLLTRPRPAGLVSAAAFYPYCPEAKPWRSPVTLLMLLGDADTVAPSKACRDFADESDGPGPIVLKRYAGVGHGFDVDEAADPRFAAYGTGTPLHFDPGAGFYGWKELITFLKLDLPGA